MAEFKYETKIFSGPTPEAVNDDLLTWLSTCQGEIEIVSSNMVVYENTRTKRELIFTVYSMFIRFPVS